MCPEAAISQENEFLDLDLSELMSITLTSVTKKPAALFQTAAAAYVICQEEIQRSGVTTLAEALRMVPGLQVARISANKWAITSRGFNGQFASKLLVMIDGRTVYSPVFSGAHWDMQSTYLPDIERIEVIRGPGATMWGANAVNGVINIITKNSRDTVGAQVLAGAGNEESFFGGGRFGTRLSENVYGRAYLDMHDREANMLATTGGDGGDSWSQFQGGFRLDGASSGQTEWTLQGDAYANNEDQVVSPYWTDTFPFLQDKDGAVKAKGANILGRVHRVFSQTSSLTFQAFYDFTDREEDLYNQDHRILDLDVQYETAIASVHNFTMGAGFRAIKARYGNTFQVSFSPERRSDNLYSAFIQDEIDVLEERVWLILGVKWEHNAYTGHEFQPNARMLLKLDDNQSVWGAVSRAVRTPSQLEDNGRVTSAVIPYTPDTMAVLAFNGSADYQSEELIAYEVGYRNQVMDNFFVDMTGFYNDYDNLVSIGGNFFLNGPDLLYTNDIVGDAYGVELSAKWQPLGWLDFQLAYTYLHLELEADEGKTILGVYQASEGTSPDHQLSLRSGLQLNDQWQVNCWLRYMGGLEIPNGQDLQGSPLFVDAYLTLDMNVAWQPVAGLELMLVGQNLLNSSKLEYVSEFAVPPTEIERSIYAKATWSF